MEPPPAPIASMSIIGTSTGSDATSVSRGFLMRSSPFWITEMSADVPPMSMVMTLPVSQAWPVQRPPMTPPAGPDRSKPTGRADEFSTVEMPPFDCMMRTSASTPFSRSRSSSRRR